MAAFPLFADDTGLFFANKNINQLKSNVDISLDNIHSKPANSKQTYLWTNQNSYILTCHQYVKEMYLVYILMENHWNLTTKRNTLG